MLSTTVDAHTGKAAGAGVALLLIDVINDLEFDGGEDLARHVLPMARSLAAVRKRAKRAGVPIIYVNDNFGNWQSDFTTLVTDCLERDVRGRSLVQLLRPEPDDYFVLKPKHSGFFSSTLDTLLAYLQARTLILTGIAGNICVLFTAQDAFMREYRLIVPADCIASNTPEANEYALRHMEAILDADIRPSTAWAGDELFQPAMCADS